jgi:anti-sigma regulatory factor (Ser/Thr protein kinase)
MTINPVSPGDTAQHTGINRHLGAPIDPFDQAFAMRFTSTRRGARLARRLAAVRLDAWGIPYDTAPHDAVVLIVAELAANAVVHGRVPGRDFELRLHLAARSGTVRVEVGDTRGERIPPQPGAVAPPTGLAESGRGLVLVEGLAARWGRHPRVEGPGKTVWAEYVLPSWVMDGGTSRAYSTAETADAGAPFFSRAFEGSGHTATMREVRDTVADAVCRESGSGQEASAV